MPDITVEFRGKLKWGGSDYIKTVDVKALHEGQALVAIDSGGTYLTCALKFPDGHDQNFYLSEKDFSWLANYGRHKPASDMTDEQKVQITDFLTEKYQLIAGGNPQLRLINHQTSYSGNDIESGIPFPDDREPPESKVSRQMTYSNEWVDVRHMEEFPDAIELIENKFLKEGIVPKKDFDKAIELLSADRKNLPDAVRDLCSGDAFPQRSFDAKLPRAKWIVDHIVQRLMHLRDNPQDLAGYILEYKAEGSETEKRYKNPDEYTRVSKEIAAELKKATKESTAEVSGKLQPGRR